MKELLIERCNGFPGVLVRLNGREITQVSFLREKKGKSRDVEFSTEDMGLVEKLRSDFSDYFMGKRVVFSDYYVDLEGFTVFQRQVLETIKAIPYGETRSYGWIAGRIRKPGASRAVGSVCGANPVPVIIPCHRVVASDGSIGGFSAGISLKHRLLHLESAPKK